MVNHQQGFILLINQEYIQLLNQKQEFSQIDQSEYSLIGLSEYSLIGQSEAIISRISPYSSIRNKDILQLVLICWLCQLPRQSTSLPTTFSILFFWNNFIKNFDLSHQTWTLSLNEETFCYWTIRERIRPFRKLIYLRRVESGTTYPRQKVGLYQHWYESSSFHFSNVVFLVLTILDIFIMLFELFQSLCKVSKKNGSFEFKSLH